jgi:hypothetical protein
MQIRTFSSSHHQDAHPVPSTSSHGRPRGNRPVTNETHRRYLISSAADGTSVASSSVLPRPQSDHVRPISDNLRRAQDIQNEHAYLLQSLRQQEERRRKLARSLSNIESQLATHSLQEGSGNSVPTPRRLRKSAGLLRSRINSATEQERLALARLGEIYAELQERAVLIEAYQHHTNAGSGLPSDFSLSPLTSSLMKASPKPSTPLNPRSSEFVPGIPFEDTKSTGTARKAASRLTLTSAEAKGKGQAEPGEMRSAHRETHVFHTVSPITEEMSRQPSNSYHSRYDLVWELKEPTVRIGGRAMSLPCLRSNWPGMEVASAF